MAIVNLVKEKEAEGEIKEIYKKIKEMNGGIVPEPFQAMANHPEYLKLVLGKMSKIMGGGVLDQKTKLIIAYVVSVLNNCEFCINMYTEKLKDAGFTDEEFVDTLAMVDLAGSMNHLNNAFQIKPQK